MHKLLINVVGMHKASVVFLVRGWGGGQRV